MLLKEIKDLEYKLLMLEEKKFEMTFNDYIILESYLDDIGLITDRYMDYLNDYNEYIINASLEDKKKQLETKNEELLNSDIEFDGTKMINFLEKYQ